jgi:rhodanese-related sulfurtransferase
VPQRVGPAEAHDLVAKEGYVLVDVRSVAEFDAGHPKGAFNVPIAHAGGAANPAFLAAMEQRFGKSDGIVVSCLAGGRSLRAATMLEAAGFTRVVDQRAGWGGTKDPFGRVGEPGWEKAGLPTSLVAAAGRSWAELEPK